MVVGEETADEGEISVPKKLSIGYFRQDVEEMKGRSVIDEAIAGSGRVGDLHHAAGGGRIFGERAPELSGGDSTEDESLGTGE